MKKETLEEAAEKYATNTGMMLHTSPEKRESFLAGAKWMEKQMENLKDFDIWKEWKNKT
jgi:hypothetical protein